jgi:hypothetical protein
MAERDPDGNRWTLETLRVLIESNDLRYAQRFQAQSEALTAAFAAQQNAVSAALLAADRAVAKAETASEKRFDAVNEFRQSLADQSRLQMPRAECEERMRSMKEAIDKLEQEVRLDTGAKRGGRDSWAIIVALIAVAANVILGAFYVAHWSTK